MTSLLKASLCGFLATMTLVSLQAEPAPKTFALPESTVKSAFADREGAVVFLRHSTMETFRYQPKACAEKLPPCSTFKIWNTLIGLETGLISDPDAPFYQWDGVKRFIPDWNQDLNLRDAFRFSCVPAFQGLARRIGVERMQTWIDRIGYGDRNTASGIDLFWLPEPGRQPLLISPDEQVTLLDRLATGQVPFSEKSRAVLADIMTARKTAHGTLRGKTGTGTIAPDHFNLAWYVGYLDTPEGIISFACILKGPNLMGKDARAVIEAIAEKSNWL